MRLLLPKHLYLVALLLLAAVGQLQAQQCPLPRPNYTVVSHPDINTVSGAACSGEAIEFRILNPEQGVTYWWNFGDNTPRVNGTAVQHAYNRPGVSPTPDRFVVSVFSSFSSSSGACVSDTVKQDVYIRQRPIISFADNNTARNFTVCLPDADSPTDTTIVIANTTEQIYRNAITTYFVDWGNGGPVEPHGAADFPLESPKYSELGIYTIRITAAGPSGCEASFEQQFTYTKEPKAGFTVNPPDEKKRAQEGQTPPCVPIIVAPTDTSSGENLTYKWEVQPAQGWTLQSGSLDSANPEFLFTTSGVYNVQLIVENGCGRDTAEQSVIIGWPQLQLPSGGVFCGPTTIDFSSSGPTGGGSGGMFIDKNFGETLTGNITITGPKSGNFAITSDVFTYEFAFDLPGTYRVRAEVSNECGKSPEEFQISQNEIEVIILQQLPPPTIQQPGIVCEGETITLAPTGPGTYFAFFESNAPTAPEIGRGISFTTPPLAGGTKNYYVAAIDTAQGVECIGLKREVALQVNPRITNNTIQGDALRNVCRGGTTAELRGSTPAGGNESFTYLWLSSTTGPTANFSPAAGVNNNLNYSPGPINSTTWFRRVARSASCQPDTSSAVQVVAVEPVPLSANTITPAQQQICAGDAPAQLVGSTPTGGGGAPYTYLWEVSTVGPNTGFVAAPGPNAGENYTIQGNLSGENWFRRIVTSGGCSTPSAAVKITVFPALTNNTITPAQQDVCTGTAPPTPLTGSAPTGGNGTYTYLWLVSSTGAAGSFAPAPGTNNLQSYTPGNITQTTYFQRVVASGECTPDTSDNAVINVRPGITNNSIAANQTICSGDIPAELTGTTPAGGSGTFTYRWESSITGPAAGFTAAAGTNTGASYTPPALTRETWFRRVVMSQGCENASEAIRIGINPRPAAPTLAVRDAIVCPGSSATLTVTPNGNNTYEWYDVATGGSPLFIGPSFTTPALTQNVIFYVQAVNTNNCASATRTAANVTVVTPAVNAGSDAVIVKGRSALLRASATPAGVTYQYQWEPVNGDMDASKIRNATSANPDVSPERTTTYRVTVSSTSPEGCEATDEVTVTVIFIPNAFSPDGNMVNDTWQIDELSTRFPDARVEVFNRWGNKVFSSTGYSEPWDGKYNGEDLPVATYYYIIYPNSSERPISGNVTIVR